MSQLFTCPVNGPKQIVVATDASPYGEAAVAEAMGLSMVCATKLTVVSVLEVTKNTMPLRPIVPRPREIVCGSTLMQYDLR